MNPVPSIDESPARQEPTMHGLAVQAAINAKLNSFVKAYEPDPVQTKRIKANFAKSGLQQ